MGANVACVLYRRLLPAALSIFTAAGGLSVAPAKQTRGPRIYVFVVVVNIVRSVANLVEWGVDNSSQG